MPCYYPIRAWRSKVSNDNGKFPLVFKQTHGDSEQEIQIPCGRCHGCKLERSRQWAMRCVHEAQLHDENCFITLTYNDENLPFDKGLLKADFQKFMKRLRKHIHPRKIKYFMCGEYGTDLEQPTQLGRPHYHAALFNYDPTDRVLYSVRDGVNLYTSETLSRVWGKGFVTVGEVTFESAAYIARYLMKKVNGEEAEEHYRKVVIETGESYQVQPEYISMSRGGRQGKGLAYDWWKQFKRDTYKDFISMRGTKMKPPKYYDTLLEKEDSDLVEYNKQLRQAHARKHSDDNTTARLRAKEKVKLNQIKRLKRPL